MTETARIKSSPQNWRAWGLIISVLTGQKIPKFDLWAFIDVEYIIAKYLLIKKKNLVKWFNVQNWLELGPQLPSLIEQSFYNRMYESNPRNDDFDGLPFDGDERLINRRQLYPLHANIVFSLNNGSSVDV